MNALPPRRLSAAALRRELEAALADRLPGAFTVHDRPAPTLAASGIPALDALTGGLPRGAMTEVFGPASSGRTTLLLAALAAATRRGEAGCLIDTADSFDPESAAAVELTRLLWVRCGRTVSSFEFPVSSENEPRAGADLARNSKLETSNSHGAERRDSYARIAQALKAADLVLQGGGFGLVAVDLAGVPPAAARRVPLASWFRFRRAVENTPAVLLLLSPAPLAQSCAALVLRLAQSALSSQHSGGPFSIAGAETGQVAQAAARNAQPVLEVPHARLLAGLEIRVEVVRSQWARRAPAAATAGAFHARCQAAG